MMTTVAIITKYRSISTNCYDGDHDGHDGASIAAAAAILRCFSGDNSGGGDSVDAVDAKAVEVVVDGGTHIGSRVGVGIVGGPDSCVEDH